MNLSAIAKNLETTPSNAPPIPDISDLAFTPAVDIFLLTLDSLFQIFATFFGLDHRLKNLRFSCSSFFPNNVLTAATGFVVIFRNFSLTAAIGFRLAIFVFNPLKAAEMLLPNALNGAVKFLNPLLKVSPILFPSELNEKDLDNDEPKWDKALAVLSNLSGIVSFIAATSFIVKRVLSAILESNFVFAFIATALSIYYTS